MLVNVSRADLSPLAAVTLVSVVASGEVIVVLLHQFLMRGAVLFAVLTELSASRISTGTFGLPWHACRLLSGITKAPEDSSFEASVQPPARLCIIHFC